MMYLGLSKMLGHQSVTWSQTSSSEIEQIIYSYSNNKWYYNIFYIEFVWNSLMLNFLGYEG